MELQLSPESTVPVDEHIASSLSGKMNFFVKFEAYETNTSSEQTLFYFNITVQLSYGSHNWSQCTVLINVHPIEQDCAMQCCIIYIFILRFIDIEVEHFEHFLVLRLCVF